MLDKNRSLKQRNKMMQIKIRYKKLYNNLNKKINKRLKNKQNKKINKRLKNK